VTQLTTTGMFLRCVFEALQKESQTEVRPAVFRSTWTRDSKT